MLLQFPSGDPFATGAVSYLYQPVTSGEIFPRIILSVRVSSFHTQAYMDTGGVFLLCSPTVAAALNLAPSISLGHQGVLFRGISYVGHLHRVPLTFIAHSGAALTIEVTAFLPQLASGAAWPTEFPCILGMSGCLERLRFAIDPFTDTFYFGELTSG